MDKEVKEARQRAIDALMMEDHINEVTSKTIVIDMDGVICTKTGPYDQREPIHGAIEAIQELSKKYIITIHTGRHFNLYHMTADWLQRYNVPFHSLVMGKPPAIAYIDDNAREFKSWDKIKSEFLG